MAQRLALGPLFLAEPATSFLWFDFLQQASNENLVNVTPRCERLTRQFGWRICVARQRIVLCGRLRILGWVYLLAVYVKAFGDECAVAQPNAIPSAEFSAHGRDFHLELP